MNIDRNGQHFREFCQGAGIFTADSDARVSEAIFKALNGAGGETGGCDCAGVMEKMANHMAMLEDRLAKVEQRKKPGPKPKKRGGK